MPTTNPRINITLEQQIADIINELAIQESRAISSMAKELILEALEMREDISLAKIAKIRDTSGKKTINHKDAWN
jgi:predicted DNA-binding protein